MIYDLLNNFRKVFEDTKVVLDLYRLQSGIYLLFKNDVTYERLDVNKATNASSSLYEYLKIRE